jgi:cytochrome P450
MSTDIYFNPWDAAFRANPYQHYKAFIGKPPSPIEMFVPIVLVGSYVDALTILRDPEHFSSDVRPMERKEVFGNAERLLFADPPTHTRLRKLISRAFTPKRINDLTPRIREFTARLLDKVAERGRCELMADLAVPLPVMVIAEMLGVPTADYERFKHWSDRIIESDNTPPGMPLPASVVEAFKALTEFFVGEIARRRERPGTDLVSALVSARDEADALTEEELVAFVILLLLAGNETTTNLIGNGMRALAENPAELAALRAHPELMAGAIEEMLRYDSPAQSAVRFTRAPAEIAGVAVPAGAMAFAVLAAANRDPARFPDPDRFDIRRTPNEHLAFGAGIHFCIGAALARLEATIAIGAALARFPRLSLAAPGAPFIYKGSYFLRGLAELPLAIG